MNVVVNPISRLTLFSGGIGGRGIHVSTFGAFPGGDCSVNRIAIQAGINFTSTRNLILFFDADTYNVCLDSSGRGNEFKTNTNIRPTEEGLLILNYIPPANLKTSNFPGGTVAADQCRAITIDNSVSPVNNITVRNTRITTPLVKWYDGSNFLKTVPIAFYMHNTGVEDWTGQTPASNYNFTNMHVEHFQRGSVTVRGRKISNVTFTDCSWTNMNMAVTQYPGENDYVHSETIVTGLAPSATSYDFNVTDGISYLVALYNGDNLLYSIPYPTGATNPAVGSIVGNPTTAGLLQWTLGAGIQAQIDSISVIAYQRNLGGTGAPALNGVAFDFASIDYLTLENCGFTGCSDQGGHYIYLTRRTNNILINNCTFTGLGINHWNNGGGIHIRGAAYENVTVSNCAFTNTHDNIHLSSVTNASVYRNTHRWNYDLMPLGNNLELTYGAINGLEYYDNDGDSSNTFMPAGWVIGYNPEAASNIHIHDNVSDHVDNINTLGVNVLVEDNILASTPYATSNPSTMVMVHNNLSFVMGVTYQNNQITFRGLNPQPIVDGFTGFTWRNNTINTVNLMRFGTATKLNNLLVENCTINVVQFYSDSMVVNNVSTVNSYPSNAIYTDMVKNRSVVYTNITDLGTQPRGVAAGAINIIKTGAVNITIAAPGNLEYFFFRSFDNVNLPYQVTLTNVSAHTITILDYNNSVASLKNFDNGGVNYNWLAGTSITLQLDKPNARWILV